MANLKDQLQSDLKTAMKNGDNVSRDTIRYTLSALKYQEIDKGGDLSEADELAFLQREAKRRSESIEQFREGNRPDLVDQEQVQLAVLERYLPAQLSDDELRAIVADAVAQSGATSSKEMGKVMPIAIKEVAGRADGKRISAAVRELLPPS